MERFLIWDLLFITRRMQMKLLNYLRQPSRRVAWTMSIEVCAVCSGNVNTLTGKNPHRFMGNSRMRFIRTLELYRPQRSVISTP